MGNSGMMNSVTMCLASSPSVRTMASKYFTLALAFAALGFATPSVQAAQAQAQGQGRWARSAYSEEELRSFEHSDETQIRQLREQEINELRIALGRRPGVHRRADLYLRLAEIYLEAYHTEFLLEGRAHEARLASGKRDAVIDRAHSRVIS